MTYFKNFRKSPKVVRMTGTSGPHTYTTTFTGTENPLSESGAWAQLGGTTGLDWSDPQKSGGIAYGTHNNGSPTPDYKDSTALLSGFAANQQVTATTQFTGSRSGGTNSHECELLLRGTYSANHQSMYECVYGYDGTSGNYAQIVKHTSVYGDFADITIGDASPPVMANGRILVAKIVGTLIQFYIDGVLICHATDSTHATGQPGIGFFWRGTENINDYGLTDLSVTDL